MERDHQKINHQESPTPLLSHANVNAKEESSPRLKRDEWSEGAVSSLLEVYEAKWTLRNRAKLKGQDWEDVASHVSSRACSTNKSPKTPTQCKNKIESMKKRYRAECGGGGGGGEHGSSWPLFSRLHRLLGGPTGNGGGGCPLPSPPVQPSPPPMDPTKNQPLALVEALTADQPQVPLTIETTQISLHSIGPQQQAKEERLHENEAKLSDQVSDGTKSPIAMDTDSSTPALYGCKDRNSKLNSKMKLAMEKRKRRRMNSNRDADMVIAESIRWLAEAVVKSEQVRMETTREMEKMRAEAEAKRAEIDLKRTEIIANTQLEIAKIFASSGGKSVGSSVMIKKN